jgi:two-component system phosphate regulon sensor histidine kinase PhoR
MVIPTPALRRQIAWALGPSLPAWAVLLALAVFGRLGWADAAIGAILVLAITASVTLRRLADFDRAVTFAEVLRDAPDANPPEVTHSATAARLLRALLSLRAMWSDRRDRAEALARSRQTIIDALPDPLLLLDRQRRIRGANAAARELFGFDLGAAASGARVIADRDLASLIRDPKVLEAVDTALAGARRGTVPVVLPAPVERSFLALIASIGGDDETALIVSLSDQTETLKVERMRADFVANASHELRTPLSAVLGFIETLRGPAREDEAARTEFLEIMFKQASRMARLIDDLLSLSRIELREHAGPAAGAGRSGRTGAGILQPACQRPQVRR